MNTNRQPEIPESLAAMWDDYRDGTLDEKQIALFEASLAESDEANALWQAESQWLEAIGDIGDLAMAMDTDGTRTAANTSTGSAFASSVVEYWFAEETQPVVGRIETNSIESASWRQWAGSVAAAIILVAGGLFLANQMNQPADNGNTLTKGGNTAPPITATASPVSLLVASTNASDLDMAHPTNIQRTLSDAMAVLDPSKLVDLLEPAMPDPADYFEQLGGKGNS